MDKPKLVVLGTGFAAFSLVHDIDTAAYHATVISPRNHFLFTPLLPSTTVGTIEFRSIIEPIRQSARGINYYQARCTTIDHHNRKIQCENVDSRSTFSLEYDLLVVAVGGVNNTFNIPGVEEHALFLKELADARAIRQQIINCFEGASTPGLAENERQRLLHFVVVGGGPTGVEFAAEMHDFLVEDLRRAFPSLAGKVRITLLEATDQILNTFDEELSAYTANYFKRQKIVVRTSAPVTKVDECRVYLKDGTVAEYGLLVWSTGIAPAPLIQSLPFKKDKLSRIIVDKYLRVDGVPEVYALGDCAAVEGENFPVTAQVAQQEGLYLARMLNRHAGQKTVKPFHYKNLGMLAYIGGRRALADLSNFKGHGFLTWLFWRSVYMTKLVSFKNKILVLFDWFKTLIFGRDIGRF